MRKNFQRVFTFVLALILALGFLSMVAMTVSANGNIDADDLFRPRITKQPASVKVANGAAVEICVEATSPTDSEMTYVWYYKDKGASDFSESSVTTDTYTTTMSDAVDGRQVYCVITNAGAAVQTDIATMTMVKTVKITKQPTSVKVANGKAAKITVQATGDGLTYQWFYKNKGESAFKKSSTITNTYSATMSTTTNGRQVYCVITDAYGNSVKSTTVTMSVNFCITKQPVSATVIKNKTVKLSVAAEGEGLTYQWYYKTKSGKSFKKLSSAKSSSYSVKVTSSKNGYQYYCVVKDKSGKTIQSSVATVKIAPKVKITKNLSSAAKASAGKSISVSVKASGDGLKYTWYYKNKGAKSYSKSSVTTATYTTTMSASVNGRKVYCVVTDKYGQTTKSKTCTLYANTTITKQPVSARAASGKTVSVSVSAVGEKLTYKWYYKDPGAKSFKKASGSKSTYSCTMTSKINGRQVYCVVKSKYGGSIKTNVVTLSMGPTIPLAITKQPVSQTGFEGDSVKLTVAAKGEGLTYAWYYKNKGASSFAKASCTAATYPTTIKPVSDGRQIYCVITDKYGTKVQTKTVTLTMKAAIQLDLSSGYWTCETQPRGGKFNQYYMVASNENVAYLLTYAYTTDASADADINEPVEIDGVTYYNYDAKEYMMNYVRSGNTLTMTCAESKASLVVTLQDDYSMVLQSISGVLNCEIMKSGDAFMFEAYPPESVNLITEELQSTFGDYGDTLTVTVKAEGEGLTYQWFEWDPSMADDPDGTINVSNQTTATYTMVLSPENAGREVFCVVTDANGNEDTSNTAILDYIAPSSWGTYRYFKPTEDKTKMIVADLSAVNKELHIKLWEPLASGEEPDEGRDLAADGIYYREPGEGFWRKVEMSVEEGLVKMAILEAGQEVAAIYLERTDFYSMRVVRSSGMVNDIHGLVESFAEGDSFNWYN